MIKFGTGGWRAVIGDDFTRENIEKVAEGLCNMLRDDNKTDKPIAVGYDRRFLSQQASLWITNILTANGFDVIAAQRSVPTPLVMFTVKDENLYCGIEVTASHNPAEYDGIKIIVEEGRDAPVEVTSRLEQYIVNAVPGSRPAAVCGKAEYRKTPFNGFLDSILSKLDTDAISRSGIRILFDSMHGSATFPLMTVLCTARCTFDMINVNKDAYFGGSNPAPAAELLGVLRDRVISEKYDLGIAVDGDGDRVGIIDPSGEYLSANQILVMLYAYLHEQKGWKGPVVRNLATTHMLDKVAASFGETCYEVPVGFKYISAEMDRVDAVLGGESSGGMTVRGHINGKDSIYSASLFVEMLAVLKKTPCQIWQEFTDRFGPHIMRESNLTFAPADKPRITRLIMEDRRLPVFDRPIDHVGYEDGCKVYFRDGSFVICRFSGTEPLLRIFAESSSAAEADGIISAMKALVTNQ